MNLVDVEITNVIIKPFHIGGDVWSTTVKTVCWGRYYFKTIKGKEEVVKKYVVGYKWQE